MPVRPNLSSSCAKEKIMYIRTYSFCEPLFMPEKKGHFFEMLFDLSEFLMTSFYVMKGASGCLRYKLTTEFMY